MALLIPCFNEEPTIAKVVTEFRGVLPAAEVYVFDNNSSDGTAAAARSAGAIVVPSPRQGKGSVVRHMFRRVEADIYLMVDGDDTYPVAAAATLVEELGDDVDMVIGARTSRAGPGAFRRFHRLGNHLVSGLVSRVFGIPVTDVFSGYRAFSRQFVECVPITSDGFEVETELTLQAAAKGFLIKEVPIEYRARPEGSVSKLNTFRDGYLVLKALLRIFKDYKPLLFFLLLAGLFAIASILAGAAPIADYARSRYVIHVPRAILAASLALLSALSVGVGLILDTLHRFHRETFELARRRDRE